MMDVTELDRPEPLQHMLDAAAAWPRAIDEQQKTARRLLEQVKDALGFEVANGICDARTRADGIADDFMFALGVMVGTARARGEEIDEIDVQMMVAAARRHVDHREADWIQREAQYRAERLTAEWRDLQG
jgi:hypothetical protein